MIIESLTYENFKGEEVTKKLYFHLTKPEFIDLQLSEDEGLSDLIIKITDAKNTAEVVRIFKKILLGAYGELSGDGETFMKSDEIRHRFECSKAYEVMYMKLLQDADYAAKFCDQLVPKFTDEELKKIEESKAEKAKVSK